MRAILTGLAGLAVLGLATPASAESWHAFSRSANSAYMADVDSIVVQGDITRIQLAIVALRGIKNPSARVERTWKIGLLVVAAMVGAVGHQGGEMTYGKDFYPKAFRVLLGTEVEASTENESKGAGTAPDAASAGEGVSTQASVAVTPAGDGTL